MQNKLLKYAQLILTITFLVVAAWDKNDIAVILAVISILFTVQYNV